MEKPKKVIDFYVICYTLKNLIRKGWQVWNVESNRLESVAEHVYGVQMLAIGMASEYKYDIDIMKVIYMLAVHELEETIIKDLTQFEIDATSKEEIGHKAVHQILSNLLSGDDIEKIILEFDAKETKEAKFAFCCDKMECDINAKLIDEASEVDLSNQKNNKVMNDPLVKSLLERGMSWSEMWLLYSQEKYDYDNNFLEVSNYVRTHKISKK